jgi:hypothetical protein
MLHIVILVGMLTCTTGAVSRLPRACLAIAILCGCPAGRDDLYRVGRGTPGPSRALPR